MKIFAAIGALALMLPSIAAAAVDYPAAKEGEWSAHDFKFHTGEAMQELKLHYTTVGDPTGIPVVVLHGSGGSAASMLTPAFAGELFGPGQPFDAMKYYIVIPDALGHGKSSKPSDGLKTKFPQYDYADMVDAQYRLLSEGLGIRHVRLIIGNSMGGMNVWLWREIPGLYGRAGAEQVKNGKLYLIPASEQTSGHLTTGNARFYGQQLRELLQTAPRRSM